MRTGVVSYVPNAPELPGFGLSLPILYPFDQLQHAEGSDGKNSKHDKPEVNGFHPSSPLFRYDDESDGQQHERDT